MSKKTLIASAFVASLLAVGAFAAPADAAPRHHVRHHAVHHSSWWPHPRPIGHHALPVRHGNISVAGLPGHHPAWHRRHHPHHPAHKARHMTHHKGH